MNGLVIILIDIREPEIKIYKKILMILAIQN